jgi:hypothetical protein
MAQSDLAFEARAKGDLIAAKEYFKEAYRLEAEAARTLFINVAAEPSRSVLYRSAATLAKECGFFDEAERLIHEALSGTPPSDIGTELRDLLDQVNFQRHLDLRGIELGEDEVQMAITGNSVGFDFASTDVFLKRVQTTDALLYRTAERKLNRPYRERGRVSGKVSQNIELFLSVPRAACFAITFRVGKLSQMTIPGLSSSQGIIDEILECLDLYNRGDKTTLRERIKEEAYFNNFVGLAGLLQPDGKDVTMVGFTCVRRGEAKQVALTKGVEMPNQVERLTKVGDQNAVRRNGDPVVVRGELLIANAAKKMKDASGQIEIFTSDNESIKVIVPSGMMSDVVRPLNHPLIFFSYISIT